MTLSPSSFLSLLLPFFFFLTIHVSFSQTLIHDTCKTIDKQDPIINPNFCTTSLQAAPASRCASLKGLGMISFRLTRFNATDTRCYIKQMLHNGKLDPVIRARLDDCFELYSDIALPSVKLAMKYYNSKKYYEANVVPQADRVLIRLEDLPQKSAGGVLLPKSAVKFERYLMGEVLAVGAEAVGLETGKKVLFSDISAHEVELGSEGRHVFCKAGDLLAVVE